MDSVYGGSHTEDRIEENGIAGGATEDPQDWVPEEEGFSEDDDWSVEDVCFLNSLTAD